MFQHTAARRRLEPPRMVQVRRDEFQHTAARRRLDVPRCGKVLVLCFNTQPPEGGWPTTGVIPLFLSGFQHTAARRRLDMTMPPNIGADVFQHTAARRRLGRFCAQALEPSHCFNTQPPEGGWPGNSRHDGKTARVSTHSRPKAAGDQA